MEEVQSKAIQKILQQLAANSESSIHEEFLQHVPTTYREISQQLADQLENEGKEYVQVPLAQIFWYHHIPLLSKVKDEAQRAYDITETAQNGWRRDVMLP